MEQKKRKRMYALVKINLKVAAAVLVSLALCCAAVITVSAVTSEEGVEIPIVMYHSLLKDEARRLSQAPARTGGNVVWV